MIFISYRQEDTKAEVTNLHRRLVERFGAEQVFVDFDAIPPGDRWPDALRKKLGESSVLLAVIGPRWGDARFTTGKKKGRLRLDDPEDWVRQEICTAIRREDAMRVIVVPIDDATLPETEWDCELDQLANLQQARIHNQKYFERDFNDLCGWLEKQVPDLKRAAESRRVSTSATVENELDHALRRYLAAEIRNDESIQLPLISQTGQPVIAPIHELRIDLPLIVSHEHAPMSPQTGLLWLDHEVLFIQDQFRNTHTNALLVDRASRFEDIRRDCSIAERLGPGSRLVIIGDPGCGKSTLLQWIDHHYASLFMAGLQQEPAESPLSLPAHRWLPILILCRDLAGQPLPTQFGDLLRVHFKLRQLSDATIASLVPHCERLLDQGLAILLVDGLDEIPQPEQRLQFCKLLTSIANRFPDAPLVITSRIVGFQAVRDELASKFDHLLVGPLDRPAKQAFIERWSKLIGWDAARTASLVQQVCYSRLTAKLTENIFLLAMVAQIHVLDHRLPGRRVDVYRRAVQLMIQRRRPFPGPPLSVNEVIPHLEFLAYRMRKQGLQRCGETEAVEAFRDLRRLEPDEPVLQARAPEELLRACVDSLGLLNVAGTETDRRGFDRQVIQFFHQSFQEYFAGQAINHGRDGAGQGGAVARLRDLLATIEIQEREVNIWGQYKIVEPVIAGYWQEAVRMAIADLRPQEADDAISMLLPGPATPPREARPRAVFALQCLADEPQVSESTVSAVFDAALDNLEEGDGFNTRLHTWMDEALVAVFGSAFGQRLQDRMIEGFIHSRDGLRNRIGASWTLHLSDSMVTPENADAMIEAAARGLSSRQPAERVPTALEMMNRFFVNNGKLGFLSPEQQETLAGILASALAEDEATRCAVIWALLWLTNAKAKARGESKSDVVYIDSPIIKTIEDCLQSPALDANTLAFGSLVLTRERGLDLVFDQRDWIYDLAVIADGGAPRRALSPPGPTGRSASVDWIEALLGRNLPLNYSSRIAQALGSFGAYLPEMVQPLRFLFTHQKYSNDERDEALIYLGWIGTSEVASLLIEAADTPPVEGDDYLYTRGLFGLLLLDDADVLAAQLRKALPHSDLNAYAYGLAGSGDPRGRALLEAMKDHPDERIRAAVASASARPWMMVTDGS